MAALEFALLLPFLMVVLIGTTESVTYLRSWYRLDRTAAEVANLASQYEQLDAPTVSLLFDAAGSIAAPRRAFNASGSEERARTVISVVRGSGTANAVAWSCSRGDTALTPTIAGSTTLPNGFIVPSGQTVLVVEVINSTRPWVLLSGFTDMVLPDPGPIRTHSIVRPRQGQLTSIGGACPA